MTRAFCMEVIGCERFEASFSIGHIASQGTLSLLRTSRCDILWVSAPGGLP